MGEQSSVFTTFLIEYTYNFYERSKYVTLQNCHVKMNTESPKVSYRQNKNSFGVPAMSSFHFKNSNGPKLKFDFYSFEYPWPTVPWEIIPPPPQVMPLVGHPFSYTTYSLCEYVVSMILIIQLQIFCL